MKKTLRIGCSLLLVILTTGLIWGLSSKPPFTLTVAATAGTGSMSLSSTTPMDTELTTGIINPLAITYPPAAPVANNTSTGIIGLSNGDNTIKSPANVLNSVRFLNTTGKGKITKVELLVDEPNPSGMIRMGVYTDTPVILVKDLGEKKIVNGWVSIDGLDIPLDQNPHINLGFILEKANGIRAQSNQDSNSVYSAAWPYGPLPVAQWPNDVPPGGTFSSNQYIMRATVDITNPSTYTINAAAGQGGTIQPSGAINVYSESSHIFNIMADTGYSIGNVSVDNTSIGKVDSYVFFNVMANHTINASFIQNVSAFTLNVNVNGSGSVAKNPDLSSYASGAQVQLTATPASGAIFSGWSGDVTGTTNPATVTMNANKTITASFSTASSISTYVPQPGGGGGSGGAPPPIVIKQITIIGFGASSELKIDNSGNVQNATQLKVEDGNATLGIAKNTRLLDAKGKALETLSATKLISMSQPPPQAIIITAYEFGPDGAQFNPPLTLTLKYDPQALPSKVDGNKLTLAGWDGSKWISVDSIVDAAANNVIAKIDHSGDYALLAELAPARFTCSDLKISEDKSQPDNPVTIQTMVTNEGGFQGTCIVNLSLNSFGVNKQEVTLNSGETRSISFVLKNLMPGNYTVDINGKSGQFRMETPSPVVAEKPPELEPNVASATAAAVEAPLAPLASPTPAPASENKAVFPMVWLVSLVVVLGITIGIIILRRRIR